MIMRPDSGKVVTTLEVGDLVFIDDDREIKAVIIGLFDYGRDYVDARVSWFHLGDLKTADLGSWRLVKYKGS